MAVPTPSSVPWRVRRTSPSRPGPPGSTHRWQIASSAPSCGGCARSAGRPAGRGSSTVGSSRPRSRARALPNILIVAATDRELCGHDGLVCGVGPVEAAGATARALALRPVDAVIHVGLAGARDPSGLARRRCRGGVLRHRGRVADRRARRRRSPARAAALAALPDAIELAIHTSAVGASRDTVSQGRLVEAMEGFGCCAPRRLRASPQSRCGGSRTRSARMTGPLGPRGCLHGARAGDSARPGRRHRRGCYGSRIVTATFRVSVAAPLVDAPGWRHVGAVAADGDADRVLVLLHVGSGRPTSTRVADVQNGLQACDSPESP